MLRRHVKVADHLKHDSGTGHLLHNAGGHLINDCGNPCPGCVGGSSTPTTIQATFSGVTLCTCSITNSHLGVPQSSERVIAGVVNGTYCLTHDAALEAANPNFCIYTGVISFTVEAYDVFNANCTGTPTSTETADATIKVSYRNNGDVTIQISGTWNSRIRTMFLRVDVAQAITCVDGTFSNTINCGTAVVPDSKLASGGSVSLVMNGC